LRILVSSLLSLPRISLPPRVSFLSDTTRKNLGSQMQPNTEDCYSTLYVAFPIDYTRRASQSMFWFALAYCASCMPGRPLGSATKTCPRRNPRSHKALCYKIQSLLQVTDPAQARRHGARKMRRYITCTVGGAPFFAVLPYRHNCVTRHASTLAQTQLYMTSFEMPETTYSNVQPTSFFKVGDHMI
jgi:hypothetical protein